MVFVDFYACCFLKQTFYTQFILTENSYDGKTDTGIKRRSCTG